MIERHKKPRDVFSQSRLGRKNNWAGPHLSSEHVDDEILAHHGSIPAPAGVTDMKQEPGQTTWSDAEQKLKAGAHNKGVIWKKANRYYLVINIKLQTNCAK